jgi:hypothetical protein
MSQPTRFAVLHHTGIAETHFDLLIETSPDEMLATWKLLAWPPANSIEVTRQADHRRVYLDYEGPLSGNRGEVRRIAGGRCDVLEYSPTRLDVRLELPGAPLRLTLQHGSDDAWKLLPTG